MATDPDHDTDSNKGVLAFDGKTDLSERASVSFFDTGPRTLKSGRSFSPQLDLAREEWQPVLCRHTVIPYSIDDGVLIFAASTYVDGLRALRALDLDTRPAAIKIVPRSEIIASLAKRYSASLTAQAVDGLRLSSPVLSAATRFPLWLRVSLSALTSILIIAALFAPFTTITILCLAFLPYFLATMVLRTTLIFQSARLQSPPAATRSTTPVVSILVPVYREAESLPALVRALCAFDYPTRALDIKILLEEDDVETIAEARWRTAGTHIECLVVPSSAPHTKPKAMNFALPFARGQITGIFDAEDAPEPDQISKAVAALEAAGEDVVCAQARLSYYNPEDNLLTRCVAMEYALWFDMLLTGMSRTRLPIPLGGTSLYFRTDTLREIGAWDPYNVTEDADLGLRLARAGKRAVIFESTTFEEATGDIMAWIRQRSRWIKGFMLTWAVHMRNPKQLVRDLGLMPMLAINILLLDGFLSFLLQPVLLLSGILMVTADFSPWSGITGFPGVGVLLALLIGGQLLLLAAAFIASRRRFGWRMALAAPLLWPYWMMGGIAAIKAAVQLVTKPQFWEKTAHCVSPVAQERRDEVLRDERDD